MYHDDCCAVPDLAGEPNDDALDRVIANMVEAVWKEKGVPRTINREVTLAFANKLWSGVVAGYGKDLITVDYDTPDFNMLTSLQKNVWHFSGAKNYQQLRELTNALIGDDGKLREFSAFKEAALKLTDKYDKNWLKAEYNLAVNGGQMAGKWVNIESQADVLPLLEFDAVIDSQTTNICRPLHGTVLPVGHPFWNRFYPPNHYNCRSTVRQLRSGVITTKIPSADIPELFQTNVGQKGLIFPPEHAYFKDIPKDILNGSIKALKTQTAHEAKALYKGQNIAVGGVGDVVISSNGIDKIVRDKYELAYVLPQLLKNASVINEGYLARKDYNNRPFTYDYVKVKGIDVFLVIRKTEGRVEKYLYDIVSKLHE